jgi:hypothetical protein
MIRIAISVVAGAAGMAIAAAFWALDRWKPDGSSY